jgi:hypothetical protein
MRVYGKELDPWLLSGGREGAAQSRFTNAMRQTRLRLIQSPAGSLRFYSRPRRGLGKSSALEQRRLWRVAWNQRQVHSPEAKKSTANFHRPFEDIAVLLHARCTRTDCVHLK